MKIFQLYFMLGLLLLSTGLFFISCEKETLIVEEKIETTEVDVLSRVSVDQDILFFEDLDHFAALTAELIHHQTKVTETLQQKLDFVSLKDWIDADQQKLMKGNQNTSLEFDDYFVKISEIDVPLLDYPFYGKSALLSKDAAVFIGQKLIKFGRDFVFAIHDGDASRLEHTQNITRPGMHDNIYASKVKSIGNEEEDRNTVIKNCTQFNDEQDRYVSSRIVANAWAIHQDDNTFFNYLDIDISVRKFDLAQLNGQYFWQPYECGEANLNAGSVTYIFYVYL